MLPNLKSGISQTFATTPGGASVVLFWYAPAPLSGPMISRALVVRVAGREVLFHATGTGDTSSPGWRMGELVFTTGAATATP